jgi:hypothetical protein
LVDKHLPAHFNLRETRPESSHLWVFLGRGWEIAATGYLEIIG